MNARENAIAEFPSTRNRRNTQGHLAARMGLEFLFSRDGGDIVHAAKS